MFKVLRRLKQKSSTHQIFSVFINSFLPPSRKITLVLTGTTASRFTYDYYKNIVLPPSQTCSFKFSCTGELYYVPFSKLSHLGKTYCCAHAVSWSIFRRARRSVTSAPRSSATQAESSAISCHTPGRSRSSAPSAGGASIRSATWTATWPAMPR